MHLRLLFVHERFGALAGAEVNLFLTADELRKRGHTLAIAHGPGTGRAENSWRELFPDRFSLDGDSRSASRAAIEAFQPDAVYVHKMADRDVLETLVESGRPLIRMVHDHDLYCLRSY